MICSSSILLVLRYSTEVSHLFRYNCTCIWEDPKDSGSDKHRSSPDAKDFRVRKQTLPAVRFVKSGDKYDTSGSIIFIQLQKFLNYGLTIIFLHAFHSVIPSFFGAFHGDCHGVKGGARSCIG